ncbi:alpha/beta-hydrolase [Sistotremastrum niveocremeum HHB9708]|uniref:Alpha/beta-hydrolase n=2 Tax=Sistotremastraceae TaxID=3402574 RepID=A0A164ZPX9_9AGAM|nr:alpha/beta-hydrolase [Sistotremastrum niveocremeum HHB9708]KZT43060.1 alpha/beta-hydrolase [Sistotremastrum suecicum HHB10207 ss-3]
MTSVLPPAADIPSSFGASLKGWWAVGSKESAVSEERLLRRLPFYQAEGAPPPPESYGVVAKSEMVPLDNPKHFLNTLSIKPLKESSKPAPPPVLLHGYGAGLGFFLRNFPALGSWAKQSGTPVYAVDWLGMGRSARPPFRVHAKRHDTAARVAQAEEFFVGSLEQWRIKQGLDKMTLVGHSLGAYLSVAYTLRHPDRVSRLILLSPAGVPDDPNTEVPSREVDSAPSTPPGSSTPSMPRPASTGDIKKLKAEQTVQKKEESRSRRLFTYLWEEGWSPFQIVRSTLFFGPWLVGKYSSRRFSSLTEDETRDMHHYILNITLAKGSGEYCISHILAPGAVARMPLVNRISDIKVPVTFVYGDHDWMDPQGGKDSVEKLHQAGNRHSSMHIIPNAGHHVYLDNSAAVDRLLIEKLNKTIPA